MRFLAGNGDPIVSRIILLDDDSLAIRKVWNRNRGRTCTSVGGIRHIVVNSNELISLGDCKTTISRLLNTRKTAPPNGKIALGVLVHRGDTGCTVKEMSNVHLNPLTVSIHVEKKGGFVEVGIAIECHVRLDKGNTGVDGERHFGTSRKVVTFGKFFVLPNSVLVNRRDGSTITLKKGDRLVNEIHPETLPFFYIQ